MEKNKNKIFLNNIKKTTFWMILSLMSIIIIIIFFYEKKFNKHWKRTKRNVQIRQRITEEYE